MQTLGRLAFIGGGNMAAALIGGLTRHGVAGKQIMVSDPDQALLGRLAETHGIVAATDNAAAVRHAEAVVLAVKPQHMQGVAMGLAGQLTNRPLVMSVAAGISHAALALWLGDASIPVVRAMPNRPALIGLGATALHAAADVGLDQRALAERIMAAVGTTVWVEHETHMDTVTALSGSGPAYFFLFMEALVAAAQARGLPRAIAHALTVETAFGAAEMARMSEESLARLREQVTSKGGTTAAALAVLEAAGLHAIVADAVAAADRRAGELALQYGA